MITGSGSKKIKLAVEKEENGMKTACHICDKRFAKAGNVRIHMTRVHKLTAAEAKAQPIKSTRKRCPHCKFFFSNMAKHLKHCPQKPGMLLEEDDEIEDAEIDQIPQFELGGKLFLESWDRFMDGGSAGLAETTKKSYRRIVRNLITKFEKLSKGKN